MNIPAAEKVVRPLDLPFDLAAFEHAVRAFPLPDDLTIHSVMGQIFFHVYTDAEIDKMHDARPLGSYEAQPVGISVWLVSNSRRYSRGILLTTLEELPDQLERCAADILAFNATLSPLAAPRPNPGASG